ncbi:hypothetical protein MOQ72_43730 [Saccharopolyspora sp. K220]|uniref:hypothetical protein n=1 Tax=Saccharopolyspora soli TaxID=2926618 RepID=UPI001F56626A|nr:hypothetical protein [Saccharopolyspora soli]MCI2424323.1 hypothetical protein [Saccharopolyspora soli]
MVAAVYGAVDERGDITKNQVGDVLARLYRSSISDDFVTDALAIIRDKVPAQRDLVTAILTW